MRRSVTPLVLASPRSNIKVHLASQRTVRTLAFFNGALLAPCLALPLSQRVVRTLASSFLTSPSLRLLSF